MNTMAERRTLGYTLDMQTFDTSREAKEFLIGKITEKADLEAAPLSDLEKSMLYFSETYWTLPDMMERSASFDARYDSTEYELKIAGFIHNCKVKIKKQSPADYERWNDAVRLLRKEDHYIIVLIDVASNKYSAIGAEYPIDPYRFGKLVAFGIAAGLVIIVVGCIVLYIRSHFLTSEAATNPRLSLYSLLPTSMPAVLA